LLLQWRPGAAAVELGPAAETLCISSGGTSGGGGHDEGGSSADSSEAMVALAAELLAACPITEVQRERFLEATSAFCAEGPTVKAKGKPSAEAVALLQSKRQRKDQVTG
jgi:hypothetical protein